VTGETVVWITKFAHLAAISLWAGGLIGLPVLIARNQGQAEERLHRMTRGLYVGLVSPAAFVAIGTGTALIFLQTTFQEWFSAKMVLVGLMASLHVVTGLVLLRSFGRGRRLWRWQALLLSGAMLVIIVPILWLVLAKPHLPSDQLRPALFAPGSLGDRFPVLVFWERGR
jgi:protoporphyrinogen IX oxidase